MILDTAFATDILDMGSDHRAVYSRIHLGKRVPLNRRKRSIRRGWKPVLNEKGQPDNYHQALHEVLCCSQPRSVPELEDVLAKAANKTQAQNKKSACDVPWNCDGFKQLLLRRKQADTRGERTVLSKQIRKELRQYLRRKRNARTAQILSEFSDLDRLASVRNFPFHTVRQAARSAPEPDDFTMRLSDLFSSEAGFETELLNSLMAFKTSLLFGCLN